MLTGTCDNYTVPSSSPAVSFHLVQGLETQQTDCHSHITDSGCDWPSNVETLYLQSCTDCIGVQGKSCSSLAEQRNLSLDYSSDGQFIQKNKKQKTKMFIVVSGHENEFKVQISSIYCFFFKLRECF